MAAHLSWEPAATSITPGDMGVQAGWAKGSPGFKLVGNHRIMGSQHIGVTALWGHSMLGSQPFGVTAYWGHSTSAHLQPSKIFTVFFLLLPAIIN